MKIVNRESGVENRELRVEPLCGDVVVSPHEQCECGDACPYLIMSFGEAM